MEGVEKKTVTPYDILQFMQNTMFQAAVCRVKIALVMVNCLEYHTIQVTSW